LECFAISKVDNVSSLYVYGSVTARVTSTQQMAYGTITDYIKIGASFKYATFTETPQLSATKTGTICQ
jgi:hypothetical protein